MHCFDRNEICKCWTGEAQSLLVHFLIPNNFPVSNVNPKGGSPETKAFLLTVIRAEVCKKNQLTLTVRTIDALFLLH